MAGPGFDLDVTFAGNDDDNILTPLGVLDYRELGSGATNNRDAVGFKIAVQQSNLDKLVATIKAASGAVYREELAAPLRSVGRHDWQWDGFGTNGILDSKLLKDPGLALELVGELGGQTRTKVLTFSNRHAEEEWLDIAVDRTKKEVVVELRINLKDGGASGVREAPPAEIQSLPRYRSIPPGDVRRQRHVRARSALALKGLVRSGLQRYWSRQVSIGGTSYKVRVDPVEATSKAMDDIAVEYNTNGEWVRSSNPGSVRGFYSFFGNFVPERIVYNVGWLKVGGRWFYRVPSAADQEFSETAAHEIGHEILSAYGGSTYSYGHRGSSTVVSQRRKPLGDGGVSYPASGEIDLMQYYHGIKPPGFYSRLVATEQDVESLIWLARVRFNA